MMKTKLLGSRGAPLFLPYRNGNSKDYCASNDLQSASFPSKARVVICGGGVMGSSVAYHLAELGWGGHTVVLEKGTCGGGTAWLSSGLIGSFKPKLSQVRLTQDTIKLYKDMEAKGLKTGWKQCGSLCIARTKDRMTVFRRMKAKAVAMTHGEIGCFLSHYFIWKKVVENKDDVIMVLEDDVQFEPYFRQKVIGLLKEVEELQLPWDLIYLGRKRLVDDENWVKGSKSLVHVAYSYWTLGYLLTRQGAQKLLEQEPLKKLIPVDEYIPILFDKHPEEAWKKHFPKRNLLAYSVAPLLLYPTHYTGEDGYISDTENSQIVSKTQTEVREDL